MLPPNPPFPRASSAYGMRRDEQQGLEEQWRAMMFTIEGSGSHDNNDGADSIHKRENNQHAEERQPISDFRRRYYKDPEGDRLVERKTQQSIQQHSNHHHHHHQSRVGTNNNNNNNNNTKNPSQITNTSTYTNTNTNTSTNTSTSTTNTSTKHPSQKMIRKPEQHPLQQRTRSASPTVQARLNESNQTVYIDGIIQSLSELSNSEKNNEVPVVPKSIMESTKNGWSIHDAHRRSLERENRRSVEVPNNNSNHRRNEYGYDRRNEFGYDQSGQTQTVQKFYESPSRQNDKMVGYDRRESRFPGDTQPRENPPPVSKMEAYYSGQDRSGPSSFDAVPQDSDPRNYHQRSRAWSLDRSLLDDQLSPESSVSPERRMFSQKTANAEYELQAQPRPPARTPETPTRKSGSSPDYGRDRYATGPRSSQNKRSILKEQLSPPPYISPTNFVPNNGRPGNELDPLEHVVDLFDTPMRLHANRRAGTKSTGGIHNRSRSERYATDESPLTGIRSEHPQRSYAREAQQTPGNSMQPTELFVQNNAKIPKTDAQKRHELEMLRGMYKDSRDEKNMSFDHSRGSKKSTSDLDEQPSGKPQSSIADQETIDVSIHDALWGSDDSDGSNNRKINAHHPGGTTRYSTEEGLVETERAASPNFAADLGHLAKSVMERSSSLNLGNKAGVDDFMKQLTRCNGTGQGSPLKLSKLFVQTDQDSSVDGNKESSLGMFQEIRRQLLSRTGIDSSGFPMGNLNDNEQAEEEDRIQEKLDAVRARSIRNAEIFEKIQSEKTQKPEEEQANPLTFFSVEGNGDQVESVLTVSTSEYSEEKSIVRHLVDHNLGDHTEPLAPVTSEHTKKLKLSHSEVGTEVTGLVTEATIGTNNDTEPKQNMYVAYSQFAQDARKVLKLCGHRSMPLPNRKKGEVLVRVHASTVSASDCAIRRGEWPNMCMDPYIIPGTALVGRVVESEKKKLRTPSFSSSTIEAGDVILSLTTSGANARFTCVPKTDLVKVPPQLNPEQVVCLAETYLEAFQSLHLGQKGGMRYREDSLEGKSILIMGGYSPFGKAVIELCRAGGAALCYALTSDDSLSENGRGLDSSFSSRDLRRQYEALEQWGAIPLSNNPQDWLTLIGRQIDIFVTTHDANEDSQGKNSITADHWKALKKEGQVHVVCSRPGMDEDDQRRMVFESSSSKKNEAKSFRIPSCRLGGREKMADRAIYYNLFDTWGGDRSAKAMTRKDLEHLVQLLEIELINPEVARRFPLSRIAKAQHMLERKKISGDGHLICSPWLIEKIPEEQKDTQLGENGRGILI